MRLLPAVTLALGLGACASPGVSGADVPEAVRQQVIETVERLFDGMRAKNLEGLREVLSPTAAIVWVDAESGASGVTSVADFLANVESAPYQLNEDMWDPEVRVDGPLATLWAPYGFYRDAEFSHWGHDAFHLVRDQSGWRIAAIAYTQRTEPMRPSRSPGPVL